MKAIIQKNYLVKDTIVNLTRQCRVEKSYIVRPFKDKVTEDIQSKVICYYDKKKCIPQRESVCLK